MRTPEEKSLTEDFNVQYQRHQSSVWRTIEREACGCDYGGTSWTVREEADRICGMLCLSSGRRLLEVGAGSGWPGLYLAHKMGCDVALVDLPFEGLRIAGERAVSDAIAGTCWTAVADGAALPFESEIFDAISHSDVLCCLDSKLDVLQDCRRVIKPNGMMVFTVISVVPGLSRKEHERAVELGPPYVDAIYNYPSMLKQSDWHIQDCNDLTREYAITARRYLMEQQARKKELQALQGVEELRAQMTRMGDKIKAIEEGWFYRKLYVAVPV